MLMQKFGIDADHVVSHYDVCAKNCPSAIRAKGDWNRFKQLIGAKAATTTVDKYYRIRKTVKARSERTRALRMQRKSGNRATPSMTGTEKQCIQNRKKTLHQAKQKLA